MVSFFVGVVVVLVVKVLDGDSRGRRRGFEVFGEGRGLGSSVARIIDDLGAVASVERGRCLLVGRSDEFCVQDRRTRT